MAATVADEASSKSEATAFTGAADGGATAEKEDSFETNNQVEGVDEADIVKSDGGKLLSIPCGRNNCTATK